MRGVEMIINGSGGTTTKGLASAELNHHIRYDDEEKETRGNGVDGEGQMLSDEDESRINNEDVENMDLVIHKPQQQIPLVPVVRWERFLHVRSLKVLLVEDDDSTRHVVSALLRNCSYEVTAVANGLQAWKILEDVTNHIDLVLTEVVMPFLSGLGLLFKIMSHQARKNIPVIMMSSHDSMGIVFKCLSKGAVDFLVKPIRKNELKNLWQHVWRKCHSSSGSGSESGVRTQISAKMISAEESDKAGSNDEDDNRSISLNTRDGSDHGSGTQSSWTKCAGEVDSPQPMSQCDQLADDPPDSTCAQVNYSRAEALCNYRESMTATREHQRQDDELDNAAMGKHLTIGVPKSPNLPVEGLNDTILNNTADNHEHKFSDICYKKDDGQFEKGQVELNSEKPNDKLRNQAVVLMDFIANSSDPQMETSTFEIPNVTESNDMTIYDTKEMFSLELCLKSLRNIEDNGTSAHNRNILRHSNLSAFSRYNSASTASPASTGNVGSYLPLDNSSETMQILKSNLDGTPPNQHPSGSSNNNDMGSTTNNAFTKPVEFNDNSAPKITVKLVNSSSAFQPVQNVQTSSLQPNIPTKADVATPYTVLAQAGEMQQQVQVHHRHHHYHHHHHHVHKLPQQEQQPSHDDLSLNKMAVASPQCGSSNVWRVPINVNASNHSLNGSASGSNHGSNGQNGSSIVVNNGVTIMEGDNDIAANGGASGSGSRSGIDENHSARRVAALNKFRQKRKERCFEKKVRYQSRKRLAEQRPRVRGQFVRQVAQENNSKVTDS